jgi:lipase chaperone LimK
LKYLRYRDAVTALPAGDLTARQDLQKRYFGDRAITLFHEENAMRAALQAEQHTGEAAR